MNTHHLPYTFSQSQKSLTLLTQDSQVNLQAGDHTLTNQKRFTRKNSNKSIQYNKNKTNLNQIQQEKDTVKLPQRSLKKNSSEKLISLLQKQNPQQIQRKRNFSLLQINSHSKPIHLGTNKRGLTKPRNFNDTFIICEQKHTSRNSVKSTDSKNSTKGKQHTIDILKGQLQLKKKQLIIQQQQTRKFRNIAQQLKVKEYLLRQQFNKIQQQSKNTQLKLKKNIQVLQKKLGQQLKLTKTLKTENEQLSKQLTTLQKSQKALQQQLKALPPKSHQPFPKTLPQPQQIPMYKIIQQLKQQLNNNKIQIQKYMQINHLDYQQKIKNYQIINQFLSKKLIYLPKYFQKFQQFNLQINHIRKLLSQLEQQCHILRLQNTKIKKQIQQYYKMGINPTKHKQYNTTNINFKSLGNTLHQKTMSKISCRTQPINLSVSQH